MEKIESYLAFIKELGQLKDVCRTAWTSGGRRESTAEHSWRLAVFAGVFLEEFQELDKTKVLMMALLHDVGEIYDGDISAALLPDPQQKYKEEEAAAQKVFVLLPQNQGSICRALWQEYEEGKTKEARLVKALDKAETIIQHNQGHNPEDFDYTFNLNYGASCFEWDEMLIKLRAAIDEETRNHISGNEPSANPE